MTLPIVKWAGGKRRILPELIARLPLTGRCAGTYFEPFAGGLALFFDQRPARAVVSDMNEDLVNLYQVVRDNPGGLLKAIQTFVNTPEGYAEARACDVRLLTLVQRAARFYYLNHTCFNGLYRVNKRGTFNVPFGKYKNPNLYPVEIVHAASRALQETVILHEDFATVCQRAVAGDFIYFDPPYIPIKGSSFVNYTTDGFTALDQERLANLFHSLAERGVRAMLSNSDTAATWDLYVGPTTTIDTIMAPRSISCKGQGRKAVAEVIVTNYKRSST
jgi:DNA adenine methylase